MIHKQFDERVEVVFALSADAFKSVSTVERTFYAAEFTLLDGLEQAVFFQLLQEARPLSSGLLSTLLNDTILS